MKYEITLLFAICVGAVQLSLISPAIAQTTDDKTNCAEPEDGSASGAKPSSTPLVQRSGSAPVPSAAAPDPPSMADEKKFETQTGTSGTGKTDPSNKQQSDPQIVNPGTTATGISDNEWVAAAQAAAKVDELAPRLEHVRIASPTNFIPSVGPFSLLIFKPYVDKNATPSSGPPLERLTYRALILSTDSSVETATCLVKSAKLKQVIPSVNIWPEGATRGTSSSPGTDFKENEQPPNKTLLHLDANIDWDHWYWWPWQSVRIYIVGGAGADGTVPRVVGSFETVIANRRWASILSALGCVVAYVLAAVATFGAHRTQRVYNDDGTRRGQTTNDDNCDGDRRRKRGFLDRWHSFFTNRKPRNEGHGLLIGTNYKSIWAHLFNPVVLSAGPNGVGSATNLQILFFSLIVFGVVCYIWMITGHLTGLSSTVVLLMGISGIGATAAAGAEVATNRLDFDNWAWLIDRGWLPPGGVAEVNAAKWKDIFTTNGSFDVYRFQMICFTVVVGGSIISVGAQATDLASFEVPSALLGILGLSQVVYVTGKLVAPPSISDLDAQITKLQNSEKKLWGLNETANTTLAGTNVVTWIPDKTLSEAQQVYADYCETWDRTKTMFETTIGRLVPDAAADKRPPFDLSDIVLNKLHDADVNADYSQTLILSGMPNSAPFKWDFVSGTRPAEMSVTTDPANNRDGILKFAAANAKAGEYRFTLRVSGSDPSQTITKDFYLKIADKAAEARSN